jgi:phosphatidylinositol dimannoside acyltransferase
LRKGAGGETCFPRVPREGLSQLRPLATSYKAAARLVRALPPGVRYPVAAAGGALWYAADRGRRRNALVNYAAALGRPEGDPEVARVARQAFENYCRMLADFLLMGSLPLEQVPGLITADGREHADQALARGNGAILALPHMGSWDFAGALASMWGYRILAVADAFPGSLNEAVVETRSVHGLDIVPLGRSAIRAINQALDRNELVALMCDLPHGPGVDVRFFGRRAVVPPGPAAIACRRGIPLLPTYCRRAGPDSYHVHIDPPIKPPAAEDCAGKDGTRQLMQRVVERFEDFIREYPEQWYAFRPILGEPA